MKKRILSMILSLVMVIGLMPTSVFADTKDVNTPEDFGAGTYIYNATTYISLASGNYKLCNNVELSNPLYIPSDEIVSIDMNDKTLSFSSAANMILNKGTLTLGSEDSTGGTIKSTRRTVIYNNGGTVSINGGTISAASGNAISSTGGVVNIADGEITAMYDAAIFCSAQSNSIEDGGNSSYAVSVGSTVNISGGTITSEGGTAIDNDGCTVNINGGSILSSVNGVNFVGSGGNLTIGGDLTFSNNTTDIFLGTGQKLAIADGFTGTASVAVEDTISDTDKRQITTGATAETMCQRITSAVGDYSVNYDSENEYLYLWRHSHDWKYVANGDVITAQCSNTDCTYSSPGLTLTLKAENRVYDGNPYEATVTNNISTVTGADVGPINYEGTGSTAYVKSTTGPTNAGTYKATVSIGDVTAEKDFTIDKRRITLTADDASKTYGEDDPPLTYTVGGLGLVFSDKLVGALEREVGTDEGKYNITQGTLTNESNPNYDITFEQGTFEITKATQATPVVTGSNETISGKADGKITGEYLGMEYRKEGEKDYKTISDTELTNLAAGKYYVRYAEKTNYFASEDAEITIESGRKLTVTIPSSQTGYTLKSSSAELDWNGTATLTFILDDGYSEDDDFLIDATNATLTDNNDNTYTISDTTGDVIVTVEGVSVTPNLDMTSSVSAPGCSVDYDGKSHQITVTAPAGATIKYRAGEDGDYSDTNPSYIDAGSYTVYYEVTKGGYSTVFGSAVIEIKQVNITITVNDASKTYGEDAPENFSWKITVGSLVAEDQLEGISVSREEGESVNDYTITASQTEDANKNYNIDFYDGTFTIKPRNITVTAENKTMVYGEAVPSLTYTVGGLGLAFSDKLVGALEREVGTDVGKYAITQGSLTNDNNPNYNITFEQGTFEITKATQTPPEVNHENETISGKADGKITGEYFGMEYRKEDEENYTPIDGTEVTGLAAGKYYVRYAEKTNYFASENAEVTIESGRKLTVTIPSSQTGYTLKSSSAELDWKGTATLTLILADSYSKTDDFSITATNATLTDNSDNTYTILDTTGDVVVTVEGIAKTAPLSDTKTEDDNTSSNDTTPNTTSDPESYTKTESGKYTDTTPETNVGGSSLVNDIAELKESVPFTEDELEQIEIGADANIWLEVIDITSVVSEEDKSLIDESLDDYVVGMYLDASMFKQIGSNDPVKLTNLNKKVKVSFTVPDVYINTDNAYNRIYQVIRIHDGVTDIIDADFDASTHVLTFETDRFSTYALIYKDIAVTTSTNSSLPQSGDDNITSLWLIQMFISLIGIVAISTHNKKRHKAIKK